MTDFYLMNANACKDVKKQKALLASDEYVAEMKWNGYRQLLKSGEAESRIGTIKTDWIPHITGVLKEYEGFWFDGELLKFPDGKAKDVTAIMQSSLDKALQKQEENGKLTYVIFDILKTPTGFVNGLPWDKRREILEHFYRTHLEYHPYIVLSGYVSGEEAKLQLLQRAIDQGMEGIMLKNINSAWKPSAKGKDSRPANTWYKIKLEEDPEDVVIIGFKDAEQFYRDSLGKIDETRTTKFFDRNWIGGVRIGQYRNGELVDVGSFSGIKDELRKDMSENPAKYIDQVVTIKAFEREANGRFISPVFLDFRQDKNPCECVWVLEEDK